VLKLTQMIKAYVFDLSRTLLFPKDKDYKGELNKLYRELLNTPNFDFSEHFYLDEETLNYLRSLKVKCDLYIFTSGTIQNAPEIKPRLGEIFKKIFSAEEMGLSKKGVEAYKKLAGELKVQPYELLYVDDSEANIKAARSAGLNTVLFTDFMNLRKKLQKHLSSN